MADTENQIDYSRSGNRYKNEVSFFNSKLSSVLERGGKVDKHIPVEENGCYTWKK